MFWSPSTKRPACSLSLELTSSSKRLGQVNKFSIQVSLETLSEPSQIFSAIEQSLSSIKFPDNCKDGVLNSVLRNGRSNDHDPALILESVRLESQVLGAMPVALHTILWKNLNFSGTESLCCNDDVDSLLCGKFLQTFSSLKKLDLSGSGLSSLPGEGISHLVNLEHLDVSKNDLSILPKEIGMMKSLKSLLAKENNVTILPGEMSKCEALEILDLSSNRLASILVSFRGLKNLVSLLLDDNPLESFPDLSSCVNLRKISFCRATIESDGNDDTKISCSFDIQQSSRSLVINFFGTKETDPIQEFYNLALRGSNHHPLIVEGIRVMMESSRYRTAFLKNEQALEKIVLMTLSENVSLVIGACKVLDTLCEYDRTIANKILNSHGEVLFSLLKWNDERQIAGLKTVETATRFCSFADTFNAKFMDWSVASLDNPANKLACQVTLLRILGNLALQKDGKAQLSSNPLFLQKISQVVENGCKEPEKCALSLAYHRLLSSLGLNNHRPLREPKMQIRSRGKRILSLDGGGMKGLATVRLLRRIEIQTRKPLRKLFDLIVGTSTGALLAVALTLKGMSLEECELIYKELGRKVFERPIHSSENDESWMSVFYRSLHMKTEHVRAVVVGCKHDTETYEQILKEKCFVPSIGPYKIESMIDTSPLDVPKIALVSTLTSVSPAQPFIFRNYEYNTAEGGVERMGSSSNAVWEAVRASSAAIYYLDSFECGGKKFQDGALVANNPSLIALQEAHQIWPDDRIDLLVSVGTGSSPICDRQGGISSYIETGSALLESATNVEEVHRALRVISNLLPDLKYYRLNPVDPRCEMELDCVDPQKWKDLELAADQYAEQVDSIYKDIVKSLN